MKKLVSILALAPLAALAQLGASPSASTLGAAEGTATNVTVVSDTKTELAWKRQVVMQRPEGDIFNDGGQVGSAAEAAATREAAEHAAEIGEAANEAMLDAQSNLVAQSSSAATNALAFALVVPPDHDRTNLTFFVVETETTGAVDTQWVWCNKVLPMSPNRFVVYETFGDCATQKCTWVSWTSNGVSRTVNGLTWSGVHKCTVNRPSFAVGKTCLDLPNDRLGGAAGFDFGGNCVLTKNGSPYYTGYVTNDAQTAVLYFDNGVYKGTEVLP